MTDMDKCSPVEMRKNLKAVDAMKLAGLDFVPIPVSSKFTKSVLLTMMFGSFEQLEIDASNNLTP